MSSWSPYRETPAPCPEGASVSIGDVMATPQISVEPGTFAMGRYRAHMIAPYMQYFDCDLRTTSALHAEGSFVSGICIGQRFQGRWSSEIGASRIDMGEDSDLTAYGSGIELGFLESQPADTTIQMSALYIGSDFFEALPYDERPPAALLSLMDGNDLTIRKLGRVPALRALFRQMYDNPCRGYVAQLQMGGLGLTAVAELAGCLSEAPAADSSLRRKRDLAHAVREFLHENATALPSMTEVAAQFGTNESSLRRAFKAAFGMPVTEYVRNRLLEDARRHIREGHLQIAEVAWRCGFSDPANFTTAYRRHFGHPPSEDRARH